MSKRKRTFPVGTDDVVLVRSNWVGKGPGIKLSAGSHVIESSIEKNCACQGKADRVEKCESAHHFGGIESIFWNFWYEDFCECKQLATQVLVKKNE